MGERGEEFSALCGFFPQYELIFPVRIRDGLLRMAPDRSRTGVTR